MIQYEDSVSIARRAIFYIKFCYKSIIDIIKESMFKNLKPTFFW